MRHNTNSDLEVLNKAYPVRHVKILLLVSCVSLSFLVSTLGTAKQTFAASATPSRRWPIQSVSSMKQTKDVICNQDSLSYIQKWVATAKKLGINYISVETPYDNPSCGNAVAYTKTWLSVIRSQGLHVWHRHMPLAFEGIYGVPKSATKNYISQISNYIKAYPTFFRAGDIFTPTPEPQNGGIVGVNCDPQQATCIFPDAAHFNQWLRAAMTASSQAFQAIGLGGKIKIGYWGFDGFIAWGDNNPDWHGILENATVQQMGNITIDHYPEAVGDTMYNDLNELQAKYPTTPIVIGEWGTITGGNIEQQVIDSMSAAERTNVVGFNYWTLGPGDCGYEALVDNNFKPCSQFDEVQSFYKGKNQFLPYPGWHLAGNNGASEAYQSVAPTILTGMNTLRITYNLHGLHALGSDASAVIIDQNGWHYISLADYGQNGLDGLQTVDIPLANFPGLNLTQPIDGTIHTRIWYSSQFMVDIISIAVYNKG